MSTFFSFGCQSCGRVSVLYALSISSVGKMHLTPLRCSLLRNQQHFRELTCSGDDLCVEICGVHMINVCAVGDQHGKGCSFFFSPLLLFFFLLRCCRQTQKSHGRCTVRPRIAREGVSAPSWRPSSPCVHGTPAPNS